MQIFFSLQLSHFCFHIFLDIYLNREPTGRQIVTQWSTKYIFLNFLFILSILYLFNLVYSFFWFYFFVLTFFIFSFFTFFFFSFWVLGWGGFDGEVVGVRLIGGACFRSWLVSTWITIFYHYTKVRKQKYPWWKGTFESARVLLGSSDPPRDGLLSFSHRVVLSVSACPADAPCSTVRSAVRVEGVLPTLRTLPCRSRHGAARRTAVDEVLRAVVCEKRSLVLPLSATPAVEAILPHTPSIGQPRDEDAECDEGEEPGDEVHLPLLSGDFIVRQSQT